MRESVKTQAYIEDQGDFARSSREANPRSSHVLSTWLECEESWQLGFRECLAGKAFPRNTRETLCFAILSFLLYHTLCFAIMFCYCKEFFSERIQSTLDLFRDLKMVSNGQWKYQNLQEYYTKWISREDSLEAIPRSEPCAEHMTGMRRVMTAGFCK